MTAKILPFKRVAEKTEELSDEVLVAACALGDRAALGALFDRHQGRVRAFLWHFLSCDPADLDDLVQATFETVQKSAARFEQRSGVRSWILGVARNVARHYLRTRARQRRIAVELVHQPPQAEESLDDHVVRQERSLMLRAAVAELSPKLREAFVLVYVQGLPGAEVANILGIAEGALWKRLFTARNKLREALGEER